MSQHSIDIRTLPYLLAVEIKETNWQFDNAGLPTILPLIFVFSLEPIYFSKNILSKSSKQEAAKAKFYFLNEEKNKSKLLENKRHSIW